ncbi:MAG: gamma-glutamylputrescine oxidase [Halocynthiibacter sp.]|jgi:gamma-glutamylputrescine oxidase
MSGARHSSTWYEASAPRFPLPQIAADQRADICIIGAGYTGLSAALHLAQSGRSVVVLEAGEIGEGASGRNGGQLHSGQRLDQETLERSHNAQDARRLWEIAQEAKALTLSLIESHRINARYRPGIAFAARSKSEATAAQKHADHLQRNYGYDQIRPLDQAKMRALIGSDAFHGGTMDRGAGHLHPLRYTQGLAQAAREAGAKIYTNSKALEITPAPNAQVIAQGLGARQVIKCDQIILACNGLLGALEPKIARHVMPINNFIAVTAPLGAKARAILREDIAAYDSKFVVNYWRLTEDHRLLFGGGESYRRKYPRDIAAKVRKSMRAVYPQLKETPIDHAWGGTLGITMSRMPFFAQPQQGVFTASGYAGHGIAMATMAGRILSDAINADLNDFNTMARIPPPPFPGGRHMGQPLLTLAMTWYAMRDRIGF